MGVNTKSWLVEPTRKKMKESHSNFKIIRCGILINEEYPWLHTTPDFLCSCDCEEGCGDVKYTFCIEVTSIIL